MPRDFPRTARLNAQFQRELTELIRDELSDPRLDRVTITGVSVAPDLKNATVRVSRLSIEATGLEDSVKALKGAAPKLQQALNRRLRLRQIPQLRFVADLAFSEGSRVNHLIRQARAEDTKAAQERGEPEEDPKT